MGNRGMDQTTCSQCVHTAHTHTPPHIFHLPSLLARSLARPASLQAKAIARRQGSEGRPQPSRATLLQGHLFDSKYINTGEKTGLELF